MPGRIVCPTPGGGVRKCGPTRAWKPGPENFTMSGYGWLNRNRT